MTHWHILGPGSIGCLWACYLHQAGHTITLIASNSEHQASLRTALPLRMTKAGSTTRCQVDIVKPDDAITVSHLLICLKTWQTAAGISAIQPMVGCDATIVLMQNGIGNQQLLLDTFPDQKIYAAITTEAACRIGPLHVEHTGSGTTWLGCLTEKTDDALPEKLACNLQTALHPEIEMALWQKLVINCCINPLTVIHQCRNGELASSRAAQQTIREVISECRQVAAAIKKNHYLDGIEAMVAEVIRKTAGNTSSMRQDILQHRPTEIDYMNGYIIALAGRHHLDTPVNRYLYETVRGYRQK